MGESEAHERESRREHRCEKEMHQHTNARPHTSPAQKSRGGRGREREIWTFIWSYEAPPTQALTTVMRDVVSVPVLSEQMVVAPPAC